MWDHTINELKKGDIVIPHPSFISDWEDDMKKWPSLTYGCIFQYFVESISVDGEAMNSLKGSEAYQYLHSKKIGPVYVKALGDLVYLKAEVEPSQRLKIGNHKAWALVHVTGKIETAGCTCIAGQGRACSHAAAVLWKVENAVREGKTGLSCTDVQRKWNIGTKKNLGQKKIKHISFKHHKASHVYAQYSSPKARPKAPTPTVRTQEEFRNRVLSSAMAPLITLQTNGLLQRCYRSTVEGERVSVCKSDSLPHGVHNAELTCEKCSIFYNNYINVSSQQTEAIMRETQMQSASQVWHDARKMRITASTAKKVPVRSTTDPSTFLTEHLYPSFQGNAATRHGEFSEKMAVEYMQARGFVVERRGLVICAKEPWMAASPDAILNSEHLLEVKCPVMTKSCSSLQDFLGLKNGDIKLSGDTYVIQPNGPRGYYIQVQLTMLCLELQSCKLQIWTPAADLVLDVPFDEAFAKSQIERLRRFYFAEMLPRLVDDIGEKKLKVCQKYMQIMKK